MIHIYNVNNKNYENNGDMILSPGNAILDMELNGLNIVTIDHPYDANNRWKSMDGDRVIKIDAPNNQTMLYRISNKNKMLENGINVDADPLMQDLKKSVLVDCRPTNANGQEAIDKILEGTKFKGHSNISNTFTSHLIRKNRLEALVGDDENSFITKIGGELFTTGLDIWINDRIGNNKGVKFEYGKDVVDFNENLNFDNVLTRVYPVGFDGITLENTGYVDSPNINKYQEILEGFVTFDDIKVKENQDDEEGFDTIEEARAEMVKRTKELFDDGLDVPTLEMDIEVAKIENTLDYKKFKDLLLVGLGDDVDVLIKHLGVNIKTRVVAYSWDIINKKFISIKLGSNSNNYIQNQVDTSHVIDNITNSNGSVNANVVQGILNAVSVQMKALRDIAQQSPVRAIICEDLIPDSPTYGAMVFGSSGFMIADRRLPDNSDWDFRTFGTGSGFTADLITAGTMLANRIKGGTLESMDGGLVIDLTNTAQGIQFLKNGAKAIGIRGGNIDFYDWNGVDKVAQIYSSRIDSDSNKAGISIAHKKNSSILVSYETTPGNFTSYLTFDMDNVVNSEAITFHERVLFNRYIRANGVADPNNIDNLLFPSGSNKWVANKGMTINGDFSVIGKKNNIVQTENYSRRLFYATEDCESYFTHTSANISRVGIDKTVRIDIEDIFKECVNTDIDYNVEIFKVGWGDYRIKEQTKDYFIVESDRDDFEFKYRISAKRRGYENVRLEEYID